jgi:hypothetical protein
MLLMEHGLQKQPHAQKLCTVDTILLFRTMEDAFTRRTHATTPPGAALTGHGGRARTDRPKRHRHSTTARFARAA